MVDKFSLAYAKQLDKQDVLREFRDEFHLPEEGVYMDGNSLGLMNKHAEISILQLMQSWRNYAIDGWTEGHHPWYYLSESLGEKMASLVGGNPDEVIVTGSTTVNLHHLVATFYQPEGKRTKILADTLNFPSDIYALKAQLQLKGYDESHLIQVKSQDGQLLREEDIIEAMTDEIA